MVKLCLELNIKFSVQSVKEKRLNVMAKFFLGTDELIACIRVGHTNVKLFTSKQGEEERLVLRAFTI